MRLTRFSILTLVAVMLLAGCGKEQGSEVTQRALRALDNLQSVGRNVVRDLGSDFNTISADEGRKRIYECRDSAQAAWISWRRSFEILRRHAREEWTLVESKRLDWIHDIYCHLYHTSMDRIGCDRCMGFYNFASAWNSPDYVKEYRAMLREVLSYVAATKEHIESSRGAP